MKVRRTYPLHQSPLYRLSSRSRLAKLLDVTTGDLRRLTKSVDESYREFSVAKKSGGLRPVENPRRELKVVQARLARLLGRISPSDYLFCPVKGRSYVDNAAHHLGHRVVRCLDVRKYFPSTSSRRVYWFFRKIMRCEKDIAGTLTSLATYKGHLPTGSPLSPILAYFAHFDVWEAISAICKTHGYRLSVYIDDVTISANHVSSKVIWDVKRQIHRAGLRYHKEKAYIDKPAEVTGVIILGGRLVAPHRQLKRLSELRAQLRGSKNQVEATDIPAKVLGIQGQLSQIRDFRAAI